MVWLLVVACARQPSPPTAAGALGPTGDPPPAVDCCGCQMWGVTGVQPGPDWQPPPLPEACGALLKDPACAEEICPVPP